MFEPLQSTRIWRLAENMAIATIDAGPAFYTEVQQLLKQLAKFVRAERGDPALPADNDEDEEARPGLSPLTLLDFASTMLLLRLSVGQFTPYFIIPTVGGMHFEYSKDAHHVLAAIYDISLFAKTTGFEFHPRLVRTWRQLRFCIDSFPLSPVILPISFKGCNLSLPIPLERKGNEYRMWRERRCQGIRTPEGFPWAPSHEEIGTTSLLAFVASVTTQSRLDEFYAMSPDYIPRPFDVTAFPRLQEHEFTDEEKTNAATTFPPLQHTIERCDLPNTLMVSDPDGVLDYNTVQKDETEEQRTARSNLIYTRVDPFSLNAPYVPLPPSSIDAYHELFSKLAYLTLSRDAKLGEGHSGQVYSATIQLQIPSETAEEADHLDASSVTSDETLSSTPEPCDFRFPKLTVAAKIPFASWENFILTEARVYHDFPPFLSQNYNGFLQMGYRKTFRAVAVVPKSYGYYLTECTNSSGRRYKPLLLLEECGKPVSADLSSLLPLADREHIYSLVQRLHEAGFIQGSMSPRNILVQPGPLHVPLAERTMKDPIYRIIDFGRGLCRKRDVLNDSKLRQDMDYERQAAKKLLGIEERHTLLL